MNSKLRILFWFILLLLSAGAIQQIRPKVDIGWNNSLQLSNAEVREKALQLYGRLGIDPEFDTLGVGINFVQNVDLLQSTIDSLGLGPTDKPLNKIKNEGQELVRWDVSLYKKKALPSQAILSQSSLYDVNGAAQLSYSAEGKVVRFRKNDANLNSFIEGSNVKQVAEEILNEMGYNPSDYAYLDTSVGNEQNVQTEPDSSSIKDEAISTDLVQIIWNNPTPSTGKPALIQMQLAPMIQDQQDNDTLTVQSGFDLKYFDTIQKYSPIERTENSIEVLFFIVSSLLLLSLVFISGLLPIIKNRVDWRQSLLIFLLVASAVIFWRAQFVWRVGYVALEWGELLVNFVNFYFLAALIALFTAIAYIGWNNLARDQKQPEYRLVNEFWNFRFLFKESGYAYLQGISLGFFVLFLSLLGARVAEVFIFNFEGSSFLVSEPESIFPAFTIGISSWSVSWIAALGQFGAVTSLLKKWFKRTWIYFPISLIINTLSGVFFLRLFGTTAIDITTDFLIFAPVAFTLLVAYLRYGIVTLSISLFVFSSLVNLLPFAHVDSTLGVVITPFLYLLVFLVLFLFGAYLVLTKESIEEEVEQLPDYEVRFQTQERVVREIEVARQTQMQLMPEAPPQMEGIDLYGFFMPSFEVGGDYYYYYKLGGEHDNTLAFTMLDVSGKAMRAAIQAVFTSGLLMSRMSSDEPDNILDSIAPMVYEHTDSRTFITCLVGRYNVSSKQLNFANAGHCLPLLKRSNKTEFIHSVGPRFPLGMKKTVDYQAQKVQLQPGDIVLLYSDGFPEAEDRKRNRLGYEGIRVMFNELETDSLSAREIGEVLKKRIIAHSGQRLADDTTVIVMKIEA